MPNHNHLPKSGRQRSKPCRLLLAGLQDWGRLHEVPAEWKDLESPGPGWGCAESQAGPEVGWRMVAVRRSGLWVGAVGSERSAPLLLPAAPGPAPRLPGLPQPHLVALSPRPASCPCGTSLCGVSCSPMCLVRPVLPWGTPVSFLPNPQAPSSSWSTACLPGCPLPVVTTACSAGGWPRSSEAAETHPHRRPPPDSEAQTPQTGAPQPYSWWGPRTMAVP